MVLFGTLGGLLRLITSFSVYIGNRQLRQSWIMYYVLLPLLGGGLAPVIYLLLRVGMLSAPVSTQGAAAENLNVFGIYAIAGLTGMFSVQAMEMLKAVFEIIFKKFEAKDSLATDKKRDEGSKSGGTGGSDRAG